MSYLKKKQLTLLIGLKQLINYQIVHGQCGGYPNMISIENKFNYCKIILMLIKKIVNEPINGKIYKI
jgi:hypothetical protein